MDNIEIIGNDIWQTSARTDGTVTHADANIDGSPVWVRSRHGQNIGRHGFRTYKDGHVRYYAMFRSKPHKPMMEVQDNAGALRTFKTWEAAATAAAKQVREFHDAFKS